MSDHALLSASGAERWLKCTPSARLEEQLPEAQSDYADEGSLAHEIAALRLTKQYHPMGPKTYAKKLEELQTRSLYNPEMMDTTGEYLEYIQSITYGHKTVPFVAIEQRVDFGDWVREGFGTSDCIILTRDTLYVTDYKHGKGVPVSAVENAQMMLYGLGAYKLYRDYADIKSVVLSIIQPRLSNISNWTISLTDLLAWGEYARTRSELAWAGFGDYVQGDHCRFCRAKALCRARADFNLAPELEARVDTKPALLTIEELGNILTRGQHLAAWLKTVEEYALGACLNGAEIPGWKAVAGRGARLFKDTDAAFELLKTQGYDEAMLYEKKPLSLAQVEKLVGKKTFTALLSEQVVSPPGKPTLVTSDDKREPITSSNPLADFSEPIEN